MATKKKQARESSAIKKSFQPSSISRQKLLNRFYFLSTMKRRKNFGHARNNFDPRWVFLWLLFAWVEKSSSATFWFRFGFTRIISFLTSRFALNRRDVFRKSSEVPTKFFNGSCKFNLTIRLGWSWKTHNLIRKRILGHFSVRHVCQGIYKLFLFDFLPTVRGIEPGTTGCEAGSYLCAISERWIHP